MHTQGDPIQANMEHEDIHHFRPLLIPGNAFRISEFQCIRTQNWQQTLENNTSLFFNTVTKFDPIPSAQITTSDLSLTISCLQNSMTQRTGAQRDIQFLQVQRHRFYQF